MRKFGYVSLVVAALIAPLSFVGCTDSTSTPAAHDENHEGHSDHEGHDDDEGHDEHEGHDADQEGHDKETQETP